MGDLPVSVCDAIRRTVGHSKDQAWKAEHDAQILHDRYRLPPDEWNSLHFHRMALDNGWSTATENHRWGIFGRVIDALHLTVGPVMIADTQAAKPPVIVDQVTAVEQASVPVHSTDSAEVPQTPSPRPQPVLSATAFIPLEASMTFSWEQVLSSPGQRFEFPGEVTRFMRREYEGPAIYRWVAFDREVGDRREVYIGEAENLCRRITNYLQPGSNQQTNVRLHARLQSYRIQGHLVTIQRLQFKSLSLGEFQVTPADLFDKHTRVFIEHMLVTYYTKAGFALINA